MTNQNSNPAARNPGRPDGSKTRPHTSFSFTRVSSRNDKFHFAEYSLTEGNFMRGLKDKRVLITGGASGIGAATAARFLEEGAQVCILDRDAQACKSIRNQLPAISEAIIADVTNLMQVEAAFAEAVRA